MAPLRSTAALALLTWLLPACGGDDTDVPETVPTVRFTSLIPSVGPRWEEASGPPPAAFVMPCDGLVAVGVATTDFLERPPGGCGATQNCGYVKIVAEFGATTITQGALQTPALFKFDPSVTGAGTFTATLVNDKGADYPDAADQPIVDTFETTFTAATDCE